MISDPESAMKVAEFLLKIRAVRLNTEEPFSWASGWQSPIYCDNRLTLSYPEVRTYLRQEFVRAIERQYSSIDAIVGVATGGIAIGALIAESMGLPFAYVRSKAKGHGMQNMIEGALQTNGKVVVIEDLVSTGGSSLKAVQALEANNVKVLGMMAIFTYGFDQSTAAFASAGVELTTLSNLAHLLDEALSSGYITKSQLAALNEWRADPAKWRQQ